MSEQSLILVTEDDQTVRDLTIDTLDALGYRAIGASSAVQALELLKNHQNIYLLMTDLGLPDLNGLELAQQAQALRPQLSILIASGYIQNQQLLSQDGETLPPSFALIGKPFTLEQLKQKLVQLEQQNKIETKGYG